jgi:F-type H+-transporting ATPase subunit epsilon
MSKIKLNLFTPQGVVVKGLDCEQLFVPTTTGEINILPEHTLLLSQLNSGVMTVKTASGDRHFTVAGGLCKVIDNKVTILSMTSEQPEAIDLERAQSALHKAQSRLSSNEHLSDVAFIKWQRKLERAKARITLGNLRQK